MHYLTVRASTNDTEGGDLIDRIIVTISEKKDGALTKTLLELCPTSKQSHESTSEYHRAKSEGKLLVGCR